MLRNLLQTPKAAATLIVSAERSTRPLLVRAYSAGTPTLEKTPVTRPNSKYTPIEVWPRGVVFSWAVFSCALAGAGYGMRKPISYDPPLSPMPRFDAFD